MSAEYCDDYDTIIILEPLKWLISLHCFLLSLKKVFKRATENVPAYSLLPES